MDCDILCKAHLFMFTYIHTHTQSLDTCWQSPHMLKPVDMANELRKGKQKRQRPKKKKDLSKLGDIPAIQEQLQEYIVRNEQS